MIMLNFFFGSSNPLFCQLKNQCLLDDYLNTIQSANKQGGFDFGNKLNKHIPTLIFIINKFPIK